MRGFRRTLFLSHLGLVALTVLLLLIAFRGLATRYYAEQLRDRLITHAAWARRMIAPKITDDGFALYLSRSDLRDLQHRLREYAQDNRIRMVVISRDLQTLADSGWEQDAPNPANNDLDAAVPYSERIEVAIALQGETYSQSRATGDGRGNETVLAMPIRREGEVIGCILAIAPSKLLTPARAQSVVIFFFVMGAIVALATLLSFKMAERLALPVRRLEEATQRLATGDLSSRVVMHKRFLGQGDELDRLTNEFNVMAEKIEAVDRERRAFLADVSHELRTPLTAIKGSAETLRDGAWKNERMAPRFADTIAAQSDRLIRLVGDLLKLARLEAATDETVPTTLLHSNELCDRASSAIQHLFDERGITLERDCNDVTFRGNADLIEQLLINLLGNAARYSDSDTTTTLITREENGGVLLQVRDQGRGIPPEHLPHLGERFYRVEEGRERSSGGRDPGGSGLGLAICRRIALAHGGTLNIDSEVGKGTVVSVHLPKHPLTRDSERNGHVQQTATTKEPVSV